MVLGRPPGGGYFHKNLTWMCLPNLENFTFYTNFLPNYPPISIPFMIEKHTICPNWVLFTIICSKYTQFLNLGPSSPMKTHRTLYQISQKSTPKGSAHTKLMWETPPPRWGWNSQVWGICAALTIPVYTPVHLVESVKVKIFAWEWKRR